MGLEQVNRKMSPGIRPNPVGVKTLVYWVTTVPTGSAGIILKTEQFTALSAAQSRAIALFPVLGIPLNIYQAPDSTVPKSSRITALIDWVLVDGINAHSATVGTYLQYKAVHDTDPYTTPDIAEGPALPDRVYHCVSTVVPGITKYGTVTGSPYQSVDITLSVTFDLDDEPNTTTAADVELSPVWQYRILSPTDNPSTVAWSDPQTGGYTFPGMLPNCPYRCEVIDIDNETAQAYSFVPVSSPAPTLDAALMKPYTYDPSTIKWEKPLAAVWEEDGGSLRNIAVGFVAVYTDGTNDAEPVDGVFVPHTSGGLQQVPHYDNNPIHGSTPIASWCAQAIAEYGTGTGWSDGWYDGPVPANQFYGYSGTPAPFPPPFPVGFTYNDAHNEITNPPPNFTDICGLNPDLPGSQLGNIPLRGPLVPQEQDPCQSDVPGTSSFPVPSDSLADTSIPIDGRNRLHLSSSVGIMGGNASAGIQVSDRGTGPGTFLELLTGSPCVELGYQIGAGITRTNANDLLSSRYKPGFGITPYLELGSGGPQPFRILL